jgi:hypothetical protein
MAETRTVKLPDEIVGAVKDKFAAGKTFALKDGRVIEIADGEEPSYGETMSIGRAMGPDAAAEDVSFALMIARTRIQGGGALTPEDLRAMPFSQVTNLLEAALGADFLSVGRKTLSPSSAPDSTPNTSKG